MTFRQDAQHSALEWKQTSSTLPAPAREPAPYGASGNGRPLDVCLPLEFASYNLLPDARTVALDRFARAGVSWHHGTTSACGNHLLSSQVQCANALAPMVRAPNALKATFGSHLDIAEALPVGDVAVDADDYVAFEWIGLADYLNEQVGDRSRSRGANNTSADALIRYRTSRGATELALIEWKYTERYQGHELTGGASSMDVRHDRYRQLWEDPDGPVRIDQVPYEDLFVEPFYQLFRLQLLAHTMERAGELGADRVRVLYAAPAGNTELWAPLQRRSFRSVTTAEGGSVAPNVASVWAAVLRRPDRFIYFDTSQLVSSEAQTSDEFRLRYGHLAASPPLGATSPLTSADDAADTVLTRLHEALSWTTAVFQRVAGEGSVLESISHATDMELRAVPVAMLRELSARLEEAAELARRVRADAVPPVFERLEELRRHD